MNNEYEIEAATPLLRPGLTITVRVSKDYAALAADELLEVVRDFNDGNYPKRRSDEPFSFDEVQVSYTGDSPEFGDMKQRIDELGERLAKLKEDEPVRETSQRVIFHGEPYNVIYLGEETLRVGTPEREVVGEQLAGAIIANGIPDRSNLEEMLKNIKPRCLCNDPELEQDRFECASLADCIERGHHPDLLTKGES